MCYVEFCLWSEYSSVDDVTCVHYGKYDMEVNMIDFDLKVTQNSRT